MAMADRRRINGPTGATVPPVFLEQTLALTAPRRAPDELRKIFLKTSLTPPATGSAFLELSAPSTLKLTASVYGPRPLPPSAGFSPHARLSAELKFAPFSTAGNRRGYVRDALERDLSTQLQVALARSVKTATYPKSGIDVFVTVLDCEGSIDDYNTLGIMQALAGAITCASAAIADAGIECVDLVSAGIAAAVGEQGSLVMDPSPLDGYDVKAAALVGYMAGRDEITLLWTKGELNIEGGDFESVVDKAVEVATQIRTVLNEAVKERVLAVGGVNS
ncbi:3' exoribonuclease family, domain 1-domain-containing protein [Sphaerosporella brunnea]|uniref:3' exoribonuclease family, domain 1-domain-containing protein n=1 Tax=Sphaerosporella brunnea TaxID=1250544 RepID=A0A5J5ED51_9PEZI|nr:3' exoribonuclease family, domain 1-domain-containing protein [Sphaerosporella brunnea]